MNTFKKTLFLGLACFALTACGGTGGSASAAPSPTPMASDGLGGTPGQPFAQRLAQTEYPKSLVNDPEAMKRILGEDKDNNGIRDDVDTFIISAVVNPEEIQAHKQYARVLQAMFLVSDRSQAYANSAQSVRALKCFTKLAKNDVHDDQMYKVRTDVRRLSVNTVERSIRASEVDVLSHGVTFSFKVNEDVSKACD